MACDIPAPLDLVVGLDFGGLSLRSESALHERDVFCKPVLNVSSGFEGKINVADGLNNPPGCGF
jgi:hypothetical protein